MYSPPQSLEKLKQENGYVKGENRGRPIGQREAGKLSRQELEKNGREKLVEGEGLKNDVGNVSQRLSLKKAVGDELVDGWPKWLVDNFPSEVLAGLVPKSADSYNKLAKSDLTRIVSRPGERLAEQQVKCYMLQLLSGFQHCHERGILQRHLKATNLLIDKKGVLRIPDFGLANFFTPQPKQPLTSRVVTLWYRAPELSLGSTDHGVGIDLWSVGCLLAEMFIRKPIMPGRAEVEQLHRIFKLCGSPTEDYWKIMRLPTSFRPPQHYPPAVLLFKSTAMPTSRSTSNLQRGGRASSNQRRSRKQPSRASREGHGRKKSISQHAKEGTESSKEVEKISEPSTNNSLETGNSASSGSTSSVLKPILIQEQSLHRPSFSPVLDLSNQNRLLRTEAHPNATKNIQCFTRLQASITDIINHNGGNAMLAGYRRSVSTLDFRTLDPEKISKLFGLDKDEAKQNFSSYDLQLICRCDVASSALAFVVM
uniref:Protein kinase domain-containing protein n=2 Tax=Populus TaxID=3689 RepID=A0A4U5N8W0_POPAL|nr:hypothetical protein D5086_0000279880 [Populus alba]